MEVGRKVRALLLPGLTYQGVLIGGGYATGRELVEFFLSHGPVGALLGLLLTMLLTSAVLACTFEFARMTRSFDYNTFFQNLMGPGRFVFEAAFIALNVLVLAVTGAAAGALMAQLFAVPAWIGTVSLCGASIVFLGLRQAAVDKLFLYWSPLLLLMYTALFALAFIHFTDPISDAYATSAATKSHMAWIIGAIAYTGYNVVIGPGILFSLHDVRTRREALLSGVLAGPIAMLPAFFFVVALAAFYPQILDNPVPSDRLIAALQLPFLSVVFVIMVFGTLLQTAVGVTKAIVDRVDVSAQRRTPEGLSSAKRALLAGALLAGSVVIAQLIGLVDLIARGYGAIAWVFVATYIIPALTLGVWRIWRGR